jgi:hypothetical protein
LGHHLGYPHGLKKSCPKTWAAVDVAGALSSLKRELRAVDVAGNVGVEEAAEARDDACQVHRIFVSLQAGDVEGGCGVLVVVIVGVG